MIISFNVVHLVDRLHESPHTHLVVSLVGHKLFAPVVHGVELADLVTEPDSLKQSLDVLSRSRHLEVILRDTHLRESRREQKVDCFRLITIVLNVLTYKLIRTL